MFLRLSERMYVHMQWVGAEGEEESLKQTSC